MALTIACSAYAFLAPGAVPAGRHLSLRMQAEAAADVAPVPEAPPPPPISVMKVRQRPGPEAGRTLHERHVAPPRLHA